VKRALILLLAILLILSIAAAQSKKKKKGKKGEEEITQTLPAIPDPPAAVTAETKRLVFHVAPLTSKGLLSQQTRDGLKSLWSANRGAVIVKIRAFVAGTGDLRRVPQIIAEEFVDKKLAVPAVSVIQVGALPMEGAQVQLESTAMTAKPVNTEGLAFFSGHAAPAPEASIDRLKNAAEKLGVDARAVSRTTCFLSNLDDGSKLLTAARAAFPSTEIAVVQLQRIPGERVVECEAVGRLSSAPGAAAKFVDPDQASKNPAYSQVALVNAEKLVFTGLQLGFGNTDQDAKLAFDRLAKVIEPLGGSLRRTVMSNFYPLTKSAADRMRAVRFNYYDKENPPASTVMLFEGLASLDAAFAAEVITVAGS
jgi:enamine deaminase RidA (YjgF/YER057c/UK114 family)